MSVEHSDLVSMIIAYEYGELDESETLELVARLVRSGDAWRLQGCYGRLCAYYIRTGQVSREGEVL